MATAIRKYVEDALGTNNTARAIEVGKTGGTAVLTGVGLGMLSSQRKGGLDAGKVPLDIAGGAIGLFAATFAPLSRGVARVTRAVSTNAIAIGAFRKTEQWAEKKKGVSAGYGHEGFGADEDPIVKAARNL